MDVAIIEETERYIKMQMYIYPNPFTQKTVIRYEIPDIMSQMSDTRNQISLKIYDSCGRLVKSFPITNNRSPITAITWDRKDSNGKRVASGIYFCRLEAGGKSAYEENVFSEINL